MRGGGKYKPTFKDRKYFFDIFTDKKIIFNSNLLESFIIFDLEKGGLV